MCVTCRSIMSRTFARFGFRRIEGPEHADRVADRGQRIAQLVGQHRQELILALVLVLDVLIEAGVVQGRGRPRREFAGEGEVARIVGAAGRPQRQCQNSERVAAGRERQNRDGPQRRLAGPGPTRSV